MSDAPPPQPNLAAVNETASAEAVEAAPVTIQPWEFEGTQGRHIATENYQLYTTFQTERYLSRLAPFYEAALAHYTTALGELPRPTVPLKTFIFANRLEWEMQTLRILGDEAGTFRGLGRGGYTTHGISVLYFIGPHDTFAIAAHEGWHQYTQQTFKHSLPLWLEEGIATFMEGFRTADDSRTPAFQPARNAERYYALRDTIRNERLIPLEDLLANAPQSFLVAGKNQLLVYYAQVWALTHFLAVGEGGRYRPALTAVLRDAATGQLVGRLATSAHRGPQRRGGLAAASRSGPLVLQEYFNSDLDEFRRQYEGFMREVAQPGGRTRLSGGEALEPSGRP
jgi:hypothetical protein